MSADYQVLGRNILNMPDNNQHGGKPSYSSPQALYQELEVLLGNVYADLAVSREQVKNLIVKGRDMADEGRAGTSAQAEEFIKALEKSGTKDQPGARHPETQGGGVGQGGKALISAPSKADRP
jgi:hypothetical protein